MEHRTALEDELKQVQEELDDVRQKWVNQNMLLELRAQAGAWRNGKGNHQAHF